MENSFSIKQLHELFLDMMKDFSRYCEQKQLRYFMVGGTLLGAAREKGFIPWDDDVDFAMPRPDYEKFLQSYCGSFRILHYKKDKRYFFPYAKVFHPHYSVINIEDDSFNIHTRVFLKFDLYPLDGMGNKLERAVCLADKVQILRQLSFINLSKSKSLTLSKRIGAFILRKIPTRMLLKMQDKLMQKYSFDDSFFVTRWRMPELKRNIVPKDMFEPGQLLPFENLYLKAPTKYEEYLTLVYGNYVKPCREDGGARHDTQANDISENLFIRLSKDI